MNRVYKKYKEETREELKKELGLSNIMLVPKLEKIVINAGVGEATQNIKVLDKVIDELTTISGQKPVIRRAKKSIATFRLREGQPIGVSVTLRGERMYDFFDRLVTITIPRIKDFRGISPKSFDGRGNYTFALRDQLVFPEIDYNKVDKVRGMSVTIVTSAKKNEYARALLKKMGMPFTE